MPDRAIPPRIIVVIPAYNEELTVSGVILSIRHLVDWDILVVDDCSSDSTNLEAQTAGASVITLPVRAGAWRAIQCGFMYARDEDYDVVVTMDADGQHSAKSLQNLVAPLIEHSCDVVVGVYTARAPWLKRMTWNAFRKMFDLSLEDVTSGFRAYNRSTVDVLLSEEATMLSFQDIGVLILLKNAQKKVVDQEVIMYERGVGISRIFPSWIAIWIYISQTTLLCVSKLSMPWQK